MVPIHLSIFLLAMTHPGDIWEKEIQIAEDAISMLPDGSYICVGFLGYSYSFLLNCSKEECVKSKTRALHFSPPLITQIKVSEVKKYYRHTFNGPPGLPQIGIILGCESRVEGDLKSIQELKKKTYVVVDKKSPSKGLADLATTPDHVFSPYGLDVNRFTNLLSNDSKLICDTDMDMSERGKGRCQLCSHSCESFLPVNCTTPEIQRQCKYYANELSTWSQTNLLKHPDRPASLQLPTSMTPEAITHIRFVQSLLCVL